MCARAGICSCMQTYTKVRETRSGAEQKIRTLLHGRVSAFHHFALLQSSELPKCIKKATKKKDIFSLLSLPISGTSKSADFYTEWLIHVLKVR